MMLIDRSIEIVRRAASLVGKKPLARQAGVAHGVLRHVENRDFSPHARKLRQLERASREVLGLKLPEDIR